MIPLSAVGVMSVQRMSRTTTIASIPLLIVGMYLVSHDVAMIRFAA
ncbi:hypothetical protein [Paenibacillus sp. GM2FR]|nr:hypothetical protein [Paenibacillus sp. GM2FR]